MLDEAEGEGYIETAAKYGEHKTGQAAKRAGRLLPLVACSVGVSGLPWARSWLSLRQRAGLNAKSDRTLMPELLAGWSFGAGRMTTSAGIILLRDIALGSDTPNRERFGTHSSKATVLSWLAKSGVDKSTRRLLGGHVEAGDTSMLEYSRDALAGPLREVMALYERIKTGQFRPDVTRSGRWKKARVSGGGGQEEEEGARGEKDQEEAPEEEEKEEEDPDQPDDEDDEDDEDAEEDEVLADDKADAVKLDGGSSAPLPPEGLRGNRSTKIGIKAGEQPERTLRNAVLTLDNCIDFDSWPSVGWTLCRRPCCFPRGADPIE